MTDDLNYIDKIVRDKVANHAVDSSLNNWAAIQRAALWKNFFTFRLSSINAYYALVVVLIGLGSLSYFIEPTARIAKFNQNDELVAETPTPTEIISNIETKAQSKPITQIEFLGIKPYINSPENRYEIDYADKSTEISKSKIDDPSNIEEESSLGKKVLNRGDEIPTNANLSKNEIVSDEKSVDQNQSLEIEDQAGESKWANTISEEDISMLVENKTFTDEKTEDRAKVGDFTIVEGNISKEENVEDAETVQLALGEIPITDGQAILEEPSVFADRLTLEGNLDFMPLLSLYNSNSLFDAPSYRLLYSDTFDYYVPPAQRYPWRMGVFYAPIYSTPQNFESNPEIANVVRQKEKNEKPAMTFSTGFSLQYQGRKRIGFQTGIAFTQLGDLFSREEYPDIDPNGHLLYADGGYLEYDTVPIVNLLIVVPYINETGLGFNDVLNYLDSLGVNYIDNKIDSAWVEDNTMVHDTTIYGGANSQNRFTYIEVPFLFSYNIPGPRLSYALKLGMAAGFLIQADGKKLNPENQYEIVDFEYDSPKYRKMNYSVLAGVDINYRFHQRFCFTTGLMYRRNLFSVYEKYPYGLKYTSTQVTFGIQYYL